ncbi:MAG: hypothetical protein RLN90_09610 [Balneolaceae bacterium]
MNQARTALIAHLTTGLTILEANQAQTIKKYAGELQEAQKGKMKALRGDIPAIYVLLESGKPLSHVPVHQFSLYFVTKTDKLDKKESEEDNLVIAEAYMKQLLEKPDFEDADTRYSLVNLEESTFVTLLNDHTHTISKVPIQVSVERE